MVNYARKYGKNYNPAYRITRNEKGDVNDCTNFVSQALYAGGWKFDNGWYRSSGNWWYQMKSGGNQTWTWGGAEPWSNFAPQRTKHLDNIWKMQYADVLQADWEGDGIIDHTMLVTKRTSSELYLTYHSSDNIDKPFSRISREVRARGNNTVKWYAYRT